MQQLWKWKNQIHYFLSHRNNTENFGDFINSVHGGVIKLLDVYFFFITSVVITSFEILVKQCCRRLSGYEDENVGIITKPYKSMPSLYTSKSGFRDEKVNFWLDKTIIGIYSF